jgi:hypothetical protein
MRPWSTNHVVVAVLTALTLLLTYPLAFHPGTVVTDPGDPLLNTWILAWDVEQITAGNIATFFDANIFHPHRRTLAYSEHLFLQALVALPILAATDNPVLAYNLILLLGFVTSGLGMYLLARELTGDVPASLFAGLVFAFSPFMFGHRHHLQIITAGGIPLALLFLHRFFRSRSWRDALLFALFFTVQILANGYYALFLGFFVAVFVLYHAATTGSWRSRRLWNRLAVAGLLSAIVAGPFFYQYRAFQKEMRFSREIRDPARLGAYLAPSKENRLWTPLTGRFRRGENSLFPGVVVLLLAGGGLLASRRATADPQARDMPQQRPRLVVVGGRIVAVAGATLAALALAALTGESGTLSLGPVGLPARYLVTALVALLLLASLGNRILTRRGPPRPSWLCEPARFYLLVLVIAFLFTFGRQGPYELLYRHVPGFDGIRAVGRWGVFVMLALAVLAALGLRALRARLEGRRRLATALLPVLLLVEYAAFPVSVVPVPGKRDLPEVYHWIAGNTEPGDPILELPLPPSGRPSYLVECPRVYASTLHWRPLVNGFSGFIPPLYRELQTRWQELDVDTNLADARALGARFVVVHGDGWKPGAREALTAELASRSDRIRLEAQCGPDTVYGIVDASAPTDPGRADAPAPRLPRTGWSAKASLGDELAGMAIDGDLETRWTSGPRQAATTFSLDLGRIEAVSGLRLRLGTSRSDHPRGYRVEASRDGLSWSVVAEDRRTSLPITAFLTPTDLSLDIVLPATECRHLRITDLDEDPAAFWSIHEIEVLAAPAL